MGDRFDKLMFGSLLVASVLLAACVDQPPTYPYDKEPNPITSEYTLGVGDTLLISVWNHREFSTEIMIRPDGSITMPLVGDMKAAQSTPSALKAEITGRMATLVKDANVTVSVTEVNSYHITVLGSVRSPGRYSSPSYLTAADAIVLAGGPDRFASADDAFVLRSGTDGKTRKIPINYEQISRGMYMQQNIYLLRGDRIVVP